MKKLVFANVLIVLVFNSILVFATETAVESTGNQSNTSEESEESKETQGNAQPEEAASGFQGGSQVPTDVVDGKDRAQKEETALKPENTPQSEFVLRSEFNEYKRERRIRNISSVLWTTVMLNMITADVLALHITNSEDLDEFADKKFAKNGMLIAAIGMQIPVSMIFMSQLLPRKANRVLNVIASVLTTGYIWGGMSTDPHYIFLASAQTLCMTGIVIAMIKWKAPTGDAPSQRKHDLSISPRYASYTYTF